VDGGFWNAAWTKIVFEYHYCTPGPTNIKSTASCARHAHRIWLSIAHTSVAMLHPAYYIYSQYIQGKIDDYNEQMRGKIEELQAFEEALLFPLLQVRLHDRILRQFPLVNALKCHDEILRLTTRTCSVTIPDETFDFLQVGRMKLYVSGLPVALRHESYRIDGSSSSLLFGNGISIKGSAQNNHAILQQGHFRTRVEVQPSVLWGMSTLDASHNLREEWGPLFDVDYQDSALHLLDKARRLGDRTNVLLQMRDFFGSVFIKKDLSDEGISDHDLQYRLHDMEMVSVAGVEVKQVLPYHRGGNKTRSLKLSELVSLQILLGGIHLCLRPTRLFHNEFHQTACLEFAPGLSLHLACPAVMPCFAKVANIIRSSSQQCPPLADDSELQAMDLWWVRCRPIETRLEQLRRLSIDKEV